MACRNFFSFIFQGISCCSLLLKKEYRTMRSLYWLSVCYEQNFISACSSRSACQLCFVLLIFLVSCCYNPSCQPSTTLIKFPFHAREVAREHWKGELFGSDNDNLIAKAKVMHTSKAKQDIHAPLPRAGRCAAIPGKQAPSRIAVT